MLRSQPATEKPPAVCLRIVWPSVADDWDLDHPLYLNAVKGTQSVSNSAEAIQAPRLRKIMRFSRPNEDVFLAYMGCGYGRPSSNDLTSSPYRLLSPEPSSMDTHLIGRAPHQFLPNHGRFRRGSSGYEPKRRRLGHGNSSAAGSLGSNQPVPNAKFYQFTRRHHACKGGACYRRLFGQWSNWFHSPSAARNGARRWQYLH